MRRLSPLAFGAALTAVLSLWAATEVISAFSSQKKAEEDAALGKARLVEAVSGGHAASRAESLRRIVAAGEASGIAVESLDGKVEAAGSLVEFNFDSISKLEKSKPHIHLFMAAEVGATSFRRVAVDRPASLTADSADGGKAALTILMIGMAGIIVLTLAMHYSLKSRSLSDKLEERRRREEEIGELSLAAAGLAHETKNPLGVIRGLAQRIAEGSASLERVREMAREIMDEADVTTARLGDFMCYAKTRAPVLEPLDAGAAARRLAGLLEPDFQDAGVRLEVEAEAEPVQILADSEMLSQILMNLLLNSLRATPKGGRVVLKVARRGRKSAELSVVDTGCGIPPETMPKLFKPYTNKKAKGYGLGLPIVKKIADKSSWSVSVESKPGEGTTVTLSGIKINEAKP